MGNKRAKVLDALAKRQELTPKDNSGQGLHYIKPGSQNRKKGYRSNAAKRKG